MQGEYQSRERFRKRSFRLGGAPFSQLEEQEQNTPQSATPEVLDKPTTGALQGYQKKEAGGCTTSTGKVSTAPLHHQDLERLASPQTVEKEEQSKESRSQGQYRDWI